MNRAILRILLVLPLLLSLSPVMALPVAATSPGALDTTFDADGKVTTNFGGYSDSGQSVAIQSDGKIVVGGVSYTTISTGAFALARYNTDGSLDTTFGAGGKVTTSFGINVSSIWSVAIYKTGPHIGKIVAAGDSTATGLNHFALARYNADGTLDTSFDTDGKVTTNFGFIAQAFSVALQSDDKIVLAGAAFTFTSGTGWDFALARYNADGSLDTTFGTGGKVITDIGGFPFGSGDAATSVAIQSDGRIVAAGYGNPLAQGNSDFALARYNTDGSLDTAFGTGGKVTTDFGSTTDYGKSVAIQSDGKLVVAGQFGDYPSADFALARYNTDGSLDTSFDTDGKVTTNFGGWDLGQSVALQSDGRIVAAGYTNAGGTLDFAVARYNANGSLDTSFDTDGKVTTDFGGGPDAGKSVAIQSDGKIVVAGSGGVTHTDFAVARYGGTEPPSNSPPAVAANNPSVTVVEGQTASMGGTYSDPDSGQNVAITASVGSVTKTGTNSGTWSWSNPAPDGPASYSVTVTANDGNGGVATTTFSVVVNNVAPTLTVNVGATNTVYYVNWTAANPGAGTASGLINLPDGSSVNVTFQALNPNGTPYYGAQTNGGTNYWSPSAPYISSEVPNAPPDPDIIQLSGGNSTIYKVTLSQPIVDPIMAIVSLGASSNTMTYNFDSPFTIVSQGVGYWGGCSTCLVQLSNNVLQGTEGHGTIKFLGTFTTFSWTVPSPEVWHGFTFAIRTTGVLGNINVNEGQTATNSGTWSDPGINDAVALSASAGTPIKNANGTWSWSLDTSDGPAQSQTISITATDKDGASTTKTFPLVVNNVPPAATFNAPATVNEGQTIVLSLSAPIEPSPADVAAGLQYAFDCGTGSGYGPYVPSSTANCPTSDNGIRNVRGKVQDKDGGFTEYTTTVQVANVAPVATFANNGPVNEGSAVTASFSNPTDPSSADTTAGFHYAFSCANGDLSGTTYAGSGTSASTTCTYDDGPSTKTVKGRIIDKDGGFTEYTTTVTVNNLAPTVNAGADQSLPFGSLVNISAAFTDPGTQDTWTYSIDWGDGSPAATGSATVGSPITGSHQYVAAGNQTITVCVTDDDLGKGCDSLTVTFVSGIGKITGGVLRFGNNGRGGFNVQSDDGVTVKGELQYQNGSVNLHARTMTAVAVSPDLKKGWFAGVLEDGRKFVVYVEDNGEPGRNDIFKMWVEGTLLNGDGKLTGGNVQIHK